ncbi:hypothetical protein ACTWQL_19250 [Pseudalkalibacillus sp. R45]|uniref:hypothetical protein n=1 Tax=Pseudalkalibacillus sp. R45 TaxID=3457433 RepID=UPI003FCD49C4
MAWLTWLFTFIILLFILLSLAYMVRTYQVNKRLNQHFRLLNCGDSGQIFFLRSLQMVLLIFFPLFVLFDDLPNLPSILYIVMHFLLFLAQIYSTIYISVGIDGFRSGIFSYDWREVDRVDIITGLHEDNHKYPSGGIIRFIVGANIYTAELKNSEVDELENFIDKHVEIYRN